MSLNRTITEIMDFLGDGSGRAAPGDFRSFLNEKIGDLSERWYRRGFKRGHVQSHKAFTSDNVVPRTLTYECRRILFLGQKRKLVLKSKIKRRTERHKADVHQTPI